MVSEVSVSDWLALLWWAFVRWKTTARRQCRLKMFTVWQPGSRETQSELLGKGSRKEGRGAGKMRNKGRKGGNMDFQTRHTL